MQRRGPTSGTSGRGPNRKATGRKLLVVSAGFATISYLGCEKAGPPGNLVPPPPPPGDASADGADAAVPDAEPESPPVVGNLPAPPPPPPPTSSADATPPPGDGPLEQLPPKK